MNRAILKEALSIRSPVERYGHSSGARYPVGTGAGSKAGHATHMRVPYIRKRVAEAQENEKAARVGQGSNQQQSCPRQVSQTSPQHGNADPAIVASSRLSVMALVMTMPSETLP